MSQQLTLLYIMNYLFLQNKIIFHLLQLNENSLSFLGEDCPTRRRWSHSSWASPLTLLPPTASKMRRLSTWKLIFSFTPQHEYCVNMCAY